MRRDLLLGLVVILNIAVGSAVLVALYACAKGGVKIQTPLAPTVSRELSRRVKAVTVQSVATARVATQMNVVDATNGKSALSVFEEAREDFRKSDNGVKAQRDARSKKLPFDRYAPFFARRGDIREPTPKEQPPWYYYADAFDKWWHKRSSASMMPATAAAQQAIFDAQNPKDCGAVRWAVAHVGRSGIGSELHSVASLLLAASADGIVLFWPKTHWAADCVDDTWGCFFQPISRCKMKELKPENQVHGLTVNRWKWPKISAEEESALKSGLQVCSPPKDAKLQMYVPCSNEIVKADWQRAAMPLVDYWHAQAVAYLMRPNRKFAQWLRDAREDEFGTPFLPPFVSAHIRHGDKGGEMDLLPWSAYGDAIVSAIKSSSSEGKLPSDGMIRVFISTEDHKVILDARADTRFRAMFYRTLRINKTGLMAGAPLTPLKEALFSFLNLWTAIEGQLFAEQRLSNWNRLIAELHQVWPSGGWQLPSIEIDGGASKRYRNGTDWGSA